MPSHCACGGERLTPRTLGRYGPMAVLDTNQLHIVLRQDMRCLACQKLLYCSDDDVRRYFEAKGIYPVCATVKPNVLHKKYQGAGSVRKSIWHTVPFIDVLYQTLRQEHSLEALRTEYMSKLQGRVLGSEKLRQHGSIVLQYWFSFVPVSATLRELVRDCSPPACVPAGHGAPCVCRQAHTRLQNMTDTARRHGVSHMRRLKCRRPPSYRL